MCPGNEGTGGGGRQAADAKQHPPQRELTNKQNNKLHQQGSAAWGENELAGFDKGQRGAFTLDRYNPGICHGLRK